jgi:hypothetical protein
VLVIGQLMVGRMTDKDRNKKNGKKNKGKNE